MKNSIRLAAIDLDGTLLGPDHQISPANLAALQHLEAQGIEILIATGRHITRIAPYLAKIRRARWAVTCQGASVLDLENRTAIHSAFLTPAESRLLVDLGTRLGYTSIIYAEDIIRAPQFNAMTDLYARIGGGAPVPMQLSELARIRTHKVIWLGSSESITRLPELPEIADLPLYHVRSHEHVYEFLPSEASKALGVAAVAERLGIEAVEVVAFGDGDNDIPLFRWAGQSFAMPHGSRAARQAARSIAPAGDAGNAFARAVEMLEQQPCPTIK